MEVWNQHFPKGLYFLFRMLKKHGVISKEHIKQTLKGGHTLPCWLLGTSGYFWAASIFMCITLTGVHLFIQ